MAEVLREKGRITRSSKATSGLSSSETWRTCFFLAHGLRLQSVRLELYFSDKRNFLIVFRDRRERQGVVQKLLSKNDSRDAISRSVIGNFVLDTVAKAMDKAEAQLESMTRRWQHREISNVSPVWSCLSHCLRGCQFAYLQLLNQHANRTPNGEPS